MGFCRWVWLFRCMCLRSYEPPSKVGTRREPRQSKNGVCPAPLAAGEHALHTHDVNERYPAY